MSHKQDLSAEDVLQLCGEYMNEKNLALVHKAYDLAAQAHEGQFRLSGEPYIIHPVQVAGILAKLRMDADTVATGFLHDVVEDTLYSLEDIEANFSPAIAFLIDGVTKLGKLKFQSKKEALAENHRKMLLAMAKDIRVIIVKLADRLHNMRTMKFQKPEKQIEKSQEAIEIYAPLADRIGMNSMKWELEDIALRYINPEAYYNIVHLMDSKRVEREQYINHTIDILQEAIAAIEIEGTIYGRPKHIYSIYRKMVDQKKDFEDIYDLLAIRVLVDSIKDCYGVLGAVHTKWKPMPGRFKDYIAMPKTNLYQSIHTTVIGPKGKPVEIQIRTYQMHEVAEYGVAAHWAYKEGKTNKQEGEDSIQKQLNWFKDLAELQDAATDASEFMDFVKEDIFKDLVYIFTPQGDVIELPTGSSPVDFAYHIHTEIGNKVTGAKVNGNIVPLDYRLVNGDIVEIMTNPNAKPSRDWIKLTATSKARNRIKRYFKMEDRVRNSEHGRDLLEKEVRANNRTMKEFTSRKIEDSLLDRFRFNEMNDFYGAVGLGEISPQTVISFLGWKLEEEEADPSNDQIIHKEKIKKAADSRSVHESGVVVEGADNLMIRLSQCCNPVPGDDIVGYITRGRGISVHRKDCVNLQHEDDMANRLIQVAWEEGAGDKHLQSYIAELQIIGYDRPSLLNDILHVINHTVKSLSGINGKTDKNANASFIIKINITNIQELKELMTKLRSIPDVYEVKRISG